MAALQALILFGACAPASGPASAPAPAPRSAEDVARVVFAALRDNDLDALGPLMPVADDVVLLVAAGRDDDEPPVTVTEEVIAGTIGSVRQDFHLARQEAAAAFDWEGAEFGTASFSDRDVEDDLRVAELEFTVVGDAKVNTFTLDLVDLARGWVVREIDFGSLW